MQLVVVSTGEVFHVEDQIGNALCSALPEVFKTQQAVAAKAKPLPVVRFVLTSLPLSGQPYLKITDGRTELMYDGDPADLPGTPFWLLGKDNRCPTDIVRAYAEAKALDNPEFASEKQRIALNEAIAEQQKQNKLPGLGTLARP